MDSSGDGYDDGYEKFPLSLGHGQVSNVRSQLDLSISTK
jgi:hypothetical protein